MERRQLSEAEINRLDKEQSAINIACDIRIMERCGYVSSPGRSLSREEIDQIAHLYSPPEFHTVSKDYNPHFRGALSRRGIEQ